ncbi:Fe-S cluster assembly sulfur transfer protein SufU [Acholeplasma equirhinis]|uniref:Fe-S cluster assembly sulfur transfer protein SufU n=1 Tax=Acholeplasma equirhinis TaxID=555393 RepID=UPI0023E46F22|nr:SUF system NifU family Fe-S cluster assembly protein [Acholeplasma equirhinis]
MDLKNLYREVIMDHYKNPQNKGLVNDASYLTVHLNNPTCGDDIVVQLKVEGDTIIDLKQQGVGCSICCSSASVASQTLMGLKVADALKVINEFFTLIKGEDYDADILEGDAIAYQTVHQFPARVKCATLAWKAYEKGLESYKGE